MTPITYNTHLNPRRTVLHRLVAPGELPLAFAEPLRQLTSFHPVVTGAALGVLELQAQGDDLGLLEGEME